MVAPWWRAHRHSIAVLFILALSAWFRLAHLGTSSLTHDEAWRANVCYGVDCGTAKDPHRLPPLQYGMGWLLQRVLGRTELVVRLPYALFGVGCVGLVYLFTRRHLNCGAALGAAAVAASHPLLVTYSRQAKGFGLEALAAVALLWVGVEAYRRRTTRSLGLFMLVGVVATGFTLTASLVIAAWMAVLAVRMLQRGVPDKRSRTAFVVIAGILTLAGGAWYGWLTGSPVGDATREHPAFVSAWPQSYGLMALGTWGVTRTDGILRFVLGTSGLSSPLKWFVGMSGFLALVASLGVLWRSCRPACLFGAVLALEVFVVGALRLWPIGELRTMTFLIPLFAIAIGCGLHRLVLQLGRSPVTAVLIAFCVLVPTARAAKSTLFPPLPAQHLRPVFAYTFAHLQPGDALFLHYETRDGYGFYGRDTTCPIRFQSWGRRDNVAAFAEEFDPWIAEHSRVWFVFMLRRPAETGPWMEYLTRRYEVLDEYRFNDAATYLIQRPDGG